MVKDRSTRHVVVAGNEAFNESLAGASDSNDHLEFSVYSKNPKQYPMNQIQMTKNRTDVFSNIGAFVF
jgi:hypothetical protein